MSWTYLAATGTATAGGGDASASIPTFTIPDLVMAPMMAAGGRW
jgi:hypothetical protein